MWQVCFLNFVYSGLCYSVVYAGVETTRRFLLEWLSYTCRYIPVGLLDVVPQQLNWRPPTYMGRDDLETLMASDSAADWVCSFFLCRQIYWPTNHKKRTSLLIFLIWFLQVRISEMLLGKVPDGFTFAPKHKSNAYDRAENGWCNGKICLVVVGARSLLFASPLNPQGAFLGAWQCWVREHCTFFVEVGAIV